MPGTDTFACNLAELLAKVSVPDSPRFTTFWTAPPFGTAPMVLSQILCMSAGGYVLLRLFRSDIQVCPYLRILKSFILQIPLSRAGASGRCWLSTRNELAAGNA